MLKKLINKKILYYNYTIVLELVEMEKTLLTFLLFAFCSLGLADNCPWPNGTDMALHWWEQPNQYFTVYDVQIFDDNGKLLPGNTAKLENLENLEI